MGIVLPEGIKKQVKTGAGILKAGGVIAYPTDTVYGLGAALEHVGAIRRIFSIKNRSCDIPLPLLVGDVARIPDYVSELRPVALKLIDTFLPGALTLVMRRSAMVPDIVTAGGDTVAIRVPAHPVTLSLIRETGSAITGTSANLSGMPSLLTADEVQSQIGSEVDFIIDAGKWPGGTESTIVDVTGEIPVILRDGAIPRSDIEKTSKF